MSVFNNLKFSTKIMLVVILGFIASYAINFWVVKGSLEQEATQAMTEKARAITQEAENARIYVADLRSKYNAYDDEKLLAEVKEKMAGSTDIIKDAKSTSYYWTIPVVAGWNVGQRESARSGFEFKVPKIEPRNPVNEPNPMEREMLLELRKGNLDEVVRVDTKENVLRYMKPVVLSDEERLHCGQS